MLRLEFKNESPHDIPSYSDPGSSGLDVRAWIKEGSVTLCPGERKLIHTGLYCNIPSGYEIQVRSRSGFTLKKGIVVANSPGTIDSSYKDEICIILYNISDSLVTIFDNDKIAQFVVAKVEKVDPVIVSEIDRTGDRGGGFGHSGVR